MLTSSARGSWLVRHDEGPRGRKRAGGASAVCDASMAHAERGLLTTVVDRKFDQQVVAQRSFAVLCDAVGHQY